ncbi:unnamed protein product [Oncorhynchus mykiss]|uniref:Uncharacterized protein n=1 Tax=Oncorhynchus mykiss TaxID=8022 RepID=A0A060YE67_ONCMY|nr:unnamed protein product [Oncorhynchus mykiss]
MNTPLVASQTTPKAGKGKPTQKEKVCHPYSRKAAYLASQEIRLGKKERQKSEKATRLNSIGESDSLLLLLLCYFTIVTVRLLLNICCLSLSPREYPKARS